jgi:hypothetical protein
MTKRTKIKIGLIVFMLVLTVAVYSLTPYQTLAEVLNIKHEKTTIQNEVNPNKNESNSGQPITTKPEELVKYVEKGASFPKYLSSNPYDYMVDNDYYKELVKKGPDVLPLLEDTITKSESNGLNEYLLAAAMEEISKVNLKKYEGKKYGWETAKGFAQEWHTYLKNIPEKVKSIQSSSKSKQQKIDSLVEMGVPAVPFIMDSIEQGNEELADSLEILLQNNVKASFSKSDTQNPKDWVEKNKSKFTQLKTYVESKNK